MRFAAIAQAFAEDLLFQMVHQATPDVHATTTEKMGAMSRLRKFNARYVDELRTGFLSRR